MKATYFKIFRNLLYPSTLIGCIIALLIPFLIYLLPICGQKGFVQYWENMLPFPLFLVQTIAVIVLAIILRKDLWDWLKSILPEHKFSLLMVIFTIAISIFAGTQIEARHRVQSDESVFMSVAQNMYHNHESATCNQGYFENGDLKCIATSNSFKTKGLSFLYTFGIPLLGTDLHWIFSMELLMFPLAVLLMFLAIVAWTRQPLLAFFASLLMALQPTVLFQFRAMSVEPLYIFLSSLSLLAFRFAFDRNTWKHWAFFALILAFFAQTRQETVFCFAPFILFALPKLLDKKDIKTSVFFVLLSIFSVPVLLMISAYQGFGFQGGEFSAHGHFLEDVAKNWEVMTTPIKNNGELENPFLSYFNWLFAFGGIYLIVRAFLDLFLLKGKKNRFFHLEILAFILLYHIQTYVILENVSGDFSIQINQRYSLVMIPSMAFLAALPIAHLIQFLAKNCGKSSTIVTFSLLLLVSFGLTGWTFHYKESFNKNIMYNRNHLTIEEHEIWNWLKDLPQKNRLFIYGRPWHFIGYGISSVHYNTITRLSDAEIQKLLDSYKDEVYYIRGMDCWDSQTYHKKAVEHRIPTTCDMFERDMDMNGVKNILITNNYWVQIAKFNGRKKYDNKNVIDIGKPVLLNAPENTAEKDSLQISYNLNESSNVTEFWETLVTMNNKIFASNSYERGEHKLSISRTSLLPGFNQIRFIVKDLQKNKKVTDNVINYLNRTEGVLLLTEKNIESHSQGWGNLHKNESIEGNKLTIDGITYQEGLGLHAPSETVYNLEGKYNTLRMIIGLDDESLCSDGVSVDVVGDGNILVKTPVFKNGTANTLSIPVAGVHKISIRSKPAGTKDCTHVDFANAVLIP